MCILAAEMNTPRIFKTDPIAVKPYVKAYIEQHGVPFNERTLLLALLSKKTDWQRTKLKSVPNCTVQVVLSEAEFFRYGCRLLRTQEQTFCEAMETRIKMVFEIELSARLLLLKNKVNYTKMILETRERIGMDEESLPFDTIKKHLDRYRQRKNISIKNAVNMSFLNNSSNYAFK